jgi:hypothetical protein
MSFPLGVVTDFQVVPSQWTSVPALPATHTSS